MRPIGFSTGALCKSDFVRGLDLQRQIPRITAVELSALRDHELLPLVEAVPALDLSGFQYVSFHAPSSLRTLNETTTFEILESLPADWSIIVHPEILITSRLWRSLGQRLCIENMDNRKSGGRTPTELRSLFEQFPAATLCLDVGHAKQVDPTMASAILMLREFGSRLRQIHVSDVGARGEHFPVGFLARVAFSRLATHVPQTCPLIIESIITPEFMEREIEAVETAFSRWMSVEKMQPSGALAGQ